MDCGGLCHSNKHSIIILSGGKQVMTNKLAKRIKDKDFVVQVILQGYHKNENNTISLIRFNETDKSMETFINDELSNDLQGKLAVTMMNTHLKKINLIGADNPLPGTTRAYINAVRDIGYFDDDEFTVLFVIGKLANSETTIDLD